MKLKPCVIWFTGLPSSGKTTLMNELAAFYDIRHTLDSSVWEDGVCRDLNSSLKDEEETIHRVSVVSDYLSGCGVPVITAFVTPYENMREYLREMIRAPVILVYTQARRDECERRSKETITLDFEYPTKANVFINTEGQSIKDCVTLIRMYLIQLKLESNSSSPKS